MGLVVLAVAAGGALLVWNMVSRTKHLSEGMLDTYRQMLARAREDRARQQVEKKEEEIVEVSEHTTAGR
jgi:hypothetical protein